jgi:hypothetical protein
LQSKIHHVIEEGESCEGRGVAVKKKFRSPSINTFDLNFFMCRLKRYIVSFLIRSVVVEKR